MNPPGYAPGGARLAPYSPRRRRRPLGLGYAPRALGRRVWWHPEVAHRRREGCVMPSARPPFLAMPYPMDEYLDSLAGDYGKVARRLLRAARWEPGEVTTASASTPARRLWTSAPTRCGERCASNARSPRPGVGRSSGECWSASARWVNSEAARSPGLRPELRPRHQPRERPSPNGRQVPEVPGDYLAGFRRFGPGVGPRLGPGNSPGNRPVHLLLFHLDNQIHPARARAAA